MGSFIVDGGAPLEGLVKVSGSKNAALPVIFAAMATDGISEIEGLPDIEDVRIALEILRAHGISVERVGRVTYIDTRAARYITPDPAYTSRLRASTYLIGASLARFGRVVLVPFGGCNFSLRPIDMHISSALSFGARELGSELVAKRLCSSDVTFAKRSVGATVNSLILAASSEGVSHLVGCSLEPHINTLIEFLVGAGASIERIGDTITVRGARLHGSRVLIPGDMIEAGTYLAIGALSEGRVSVTGADTQELSSFCAPFLCRGMTVETSEHGSSFHGSAIGAVDILTAPYPGFPTDLQPIAAPLLAVGHGGTITDTVWPERFGYLGELGKMGVQYSIDENRATIYPSRLYPGEVRAVDLRGGAACLICALAASGRSEVRCADVILRGYEDPITKLRALGARISYKDKS